MCGYNLNLKEMLFAILLNDSILRGGVLDDALKVARRLEANVMQCAKLTNCVGHLRNWARHSTQK